MPGQYEAQVILNFKLRKNNLQRGATLEQKTVEGEQQPYNYLRRKRRSRRNSKTEYRKQKMEYRNVHRNRKEANVAEAESAGRKWKEMRSGK